jgi:hypothetical protein
MSWSLNLIGRPAAIARAIEEMSAKLDGQSKVEFDAAKPHLAGLVGQNFVKPGEGQIEPVMQLNASGSGYVSGGVQQYRSCAVELKSLYGRLVTDDDDPRPAAAPAEAPGAAPPADATEAAEPGVAAHA